MGYCYTAHIYGGKFTKKKLRQALEAAQALMDKVQEDGSGGSWRGSQLISRHYSWVRTETCVDAITRGLSAKSERANGLRDFLREWRYLTEELEDGGVVITDFIGEKIGDETTLWKALAPYMERTAIHCTGEDGERWIWVIDNGGFSEIAAQTTYPGAPSWATSDW